MILFINLKDVKVYGINYKAVPMLKLTTKGTFKLGSLNKSQKEVLRLLKHEAKINGFKILINDEHTFI